MNRPALSVALLAALVVAAPAAAGPTVFWTFGFDLPLSPGRAPRFADANMPRRLPAATPAPAPLPFAGVQLALATPLSAYGRITLQP